MYNLNEIMFHLFLLVFSQSGPLLSDWPEENMVAADRYVHYEFHIFVLKEQALEHTGERMAKIIPKITLQHHLQEF